jgi:hypothetical protein
MARKVSKPKHVEPEYERQETRAQNAADGKAFTKSAAAREAIAQGIESPQKASAFIKERFGIDMAPQHFSAVKSLIKKKEASTAPRAKRGPKPKSAEAAKDYLAPPPKNPASGEPDLLAVMEAMKPLVASLGADKVKRIVDLLG